VDKVIDLKTSSLADLRDEFIRLGNELSVIDGQRRQLNAEIQRRVQQAATTERLRAKTPLEREALARALDEFKG
jgi:hypothetical protein